MNLVKFLLVGALFSTILGEFAHYPFGATTAISLSDILVGLTDLFFIIWVVISRTKIKIPAAFRFMLLFWLVCFFSIIFSLTKFPFLDVAIGGLYLVRFILYSLLFLIAFNLNKLKILEKEQFLGLIINVGLIIVILGFAQLIILPSFDSQLLPLTDFGFDPHQGRLTALFLDPNFAGAYLVFLSGIIFYKFVISKEKISWAVMLCISLVGLILTYSRSAYLMMVIFLFSLFFLSWNEIHKKMKVLLVSAFLCSILIISLLFPRFTQRIWSGVLLDKSSSERIVSWEGGIEIFQNNPLLGVGFDNIRIAKNEFNLFKTYSPNGGHSGAGIDSGFLFVLATTGITGFLFYILFWIKIVTRTYKKSWFLNIIFSLIISLFVESQFINSLFFPSLMLLYFTTIGVGVGEAEL